MRLIYAGVYGKSISVEFRTVIVAVFKRIAVEYIYRNSSLSATQFTVEKSNSVERFAMIEKTVFVVQLQSLHEISQRENSFGDLS